MLVLFILKIEILKQQLPSHVRFQSLEGCMQFDVNDPLICFPTFFDQLLWQLQPVLLENLPMYPRDHSVSCKMTDVAGPYFKKGL